MVGLKALTAAEPEKIIGHHLKNVLFQGFEIKTLKGLGILKALLHGV